MWRVGIEREREGRVSLIPMKKKKREKRKSVSEKMRVEELKKMKKRDFLF